MDLTGHLRIERHSCGTERIARTIIAPLYLGTCSSQLDSGELKSPPTRVARSSIWVHINRLALPSRLSKALSGFFNPRLIPKFDLSPRTNTRSLKMPAMKPQTNFRTVQTLNLDYAPVTITNYVSTRTGMRAVVVDQPGPKVNGYFALATEIRDDSGAPHTLEHLVFMGSKSYAYKGLLDKLAARAYSTTNAWTAVEHTAYTLDTAGWAGFAQILPVYLEHIIVPTLTDAGCYTEVHHVDGTGHDAGVVYSEMQGVQNTGPELMELRARRLLYPEGNGFRSETGGMMEQVRVLTADRIREYHKEMYQPKNLCLVLTGEVNHEELLRILDQFEDTIIDDVPALDAPFTRPWLESAPTPPLEKTIVETVDFPEEDESMGEVLLGFFGPKSDDHIGCAALSIMLMYLCESSICVLENVLVEKEQMCSMVSYSTDYRPDMLIWFSLSAVETDQLEAVEKRVITLLQETAAKELDLGYMQDCITRWRRQIKMKCEDAASFFADPIIEDHLFGHRDGRDLKTLATIEELNVLAKWTDREWRDFLSRYLADAKHVGILGKPSQALSKKLTTEEEARVKAQQERLGEDGLKKLAEKLKAAQEENDMPIPDSVLEQFPVPPADSVHFVSTTSARAGKAREMGALDNDIQRIIDQDDNDSPLFMHFENVPSNFVRMQVDLCTGSVPVELKPLLALYIMNFFATPVMREGKRIEFEDLVLAMERETVGYGVDFMRSNGEMLYIAFHTEPENYEKVISWLRTLLFDAVHDPDRLLSQLKKILADIPDEKRSGDSMASAVYSMLQYKQESSVRARNTLSKSLFLKRYKKLLKVDEKVALDQFSELCKTLHRPENFRIFISADVSKLPKPVSAWEPLSKGFDTSKPLEPLDDRFALLSELGRNPGKTCVIVPMATVESSSTLLVAKGVDSYDHPDLPAMNVARAYMDAVEGPFWIAVRGTGLAYTAAFPRSNNMARGLIMYRIMRSPDAYKAFVAAKDQVEGYASGRLEFNKHALEGAVSEIVLDMADEQPTMAAAADYSYTNQVIRGIDKDWSHQMLAKVQAVTPAQIRAVLQKYFLPVFEPETSNLVVTCANIMKDKLEANLKEAGYAPEVRTLESFQDGYGLEAVGGGDEADEEESEDDSDEDDEDDAMDTPESGSEN